MLANLAMFVVAVIAALALHVALVLAPMLRFGAGVSLASFARGIADALMLAFSTASSSVALPVSMAARNRLGVPNDIAAFVLPAGATINKNGAAVYKAVTAVFLATLYGLPLGPARWIAIVPHRPSRRSPAPACRAVRS